MTFTKRALSGSSEGNCPILINTTSSTNANTIHQCSSSTGINSFDEYWLYGYNGSSTSVTLTVQLGSSNLAFKNSIASQSGWVPLNPGFIMNTTQLILAYATTTNEIQITGWINRMSS